MKRRRLETNQPVIIIYDSAIGFVQQPAKFLRYHRIMYGGIEHETPIFEYNDREITGIECFWLLPTDATSQERIERIQYKLISIQLSALELGKLFNYEVPNKIKDSRLTSMALENVDRLEAVIEKLGFDPRDESWIEKDLALNDKERLWFKFERENALVFVEEWDEMTNQFNAQNNMEITIDEAKNLSRKRMRYLLGSFHVRMSGNGKQEDWKESARQFEKEHRGLENRMLTWTRQHQPKFPIVRSRKPIAFFYGPYFNECIEKIPHVFTSTDCNQIKEGVVLRVLSYDPKTKTVRLDFTPDIRAKIKGEEDAEPWLKDKADYDMWIKPEQFDEFIEILEPIV